MEARRRYRVRIVGQVGSCVVSACSRYHAIDICYSKYSATESDRRLYYVRNGLL